MIFQPNTHMVSAGTRNTMKIQWFDRWSERRKKCYFKWIPLFCFLKMLKYHKAVINFRTSIKKNPIPFVKQKCKLLVKHFHTTYIEYVSVIAGTWWVTYYRLAVLRVFNDNVISATKIKGGIKLHMRDLFQLLQ